VIVFIDSNIPMYVAGKDHPHRDPSRRFLAAVQRNEIEGCTGTEVLQEILYRYSALQRIDLAREVYDLFVEWIATFDAGFNRVAGVRRFELK
jgi:predicted nucleic acid-binding protein